MQATLIRDRFIQFFTQRGHFHQAAVPIVNREDPSLLFVNAGMNPFKEVICGHQPIAQPRVVTVQPCLRVAGKHNDLEEVGRDTYHHTLFEMLGNWSFGDYFKKEAIAWAWELLTVVYGLPPERLYATVFGGDRTDALPPDQEAAAIWANYLPATHILSFAKADNFWEMGAQGPCGPCSEIHIDLRSEGERQSVSAAQLVNQGHPQVIEIWNLVFMQYNRQATGSLVALPSRHIDTGMGLERLAMVLQGKRSSYDTDIFLPLITQIAEIAGKGYGEGEPIAVAMRVVADHVRAVVFAIADGQLPAATQAGYVLRRILRRASCYGYSHLAIREPFIYQLVSTVVAQMGDVYPHLRQQQNHIAKVIHEEEKAFLKTLASGLQRFHVVTADSQNILSGKVAFELYDTYGFPLDLIQLLAKEKGIQVAEAAFQAALQEQRERSQQDAAVVYGDWEVLQPDRRSLFVGYDQWEVTTTLIQWRQVTTKQGKRYQLVLAETPFYPEGGGQVADSGCIRSGTYCMEVEEVQRLHGLIIHTVGQLPTPLTQPVIASIDRTKRILTASNHTATHLLQAALRAVLGNHVVQKGSLVTPALLRFDFEHPAKLTAAQIAAVEALVNSKIRANIPCLEQRAVPLQTAQAMGAQALFGEKYGSHVRVIAFEPTFSIELCGGTHVAATGQIGLFKVVSETAIGSGIRRIEAVTATHAERWIAQKLDDLAAIVALLKQPKDPVKAVEALLKEQKAWQRKLIDYEKKAIAAIQLTLQVETVGESHLLVQRVELPSVEALRQVAFQWRAKHKKIFIALAISLQGKAYVALALSDALLPYGHAHHWIQSIAPLIGGRGGGQPFFAMAGGDQPGGITAALQEARRLCLLYLML